MDSSRKRGPDETASSAVTPTALDVAAESLISERMRGWLRGVEEWARDDFHVNNCESYFSIFKRGMKGVYQHCSEKHVHRYLAEFDFRYNNRSAKGIEDQQRTSNALLQIEGKRLTYRRIDRVES